MAVGDNIETRGHIFGFREEIAKAAHDDNAFFNWFNDSGDKKSSFRRGHLDFDQHFLRIAGPFLGDMSKQTALEIGYGGGRLLAAASGRFLRVIGVDIHDCADKVGAELTEQGLDNFELIQNSGWEIPVERAAADFVYSFIVLQHVEKVAIFERYVQEIFRVLKPGAYALIYFGRKNRLSRNRGWALLNWLDYQLEAIYLPRGFEEIPAKVNCINLVISKRYAEEFCQKTGFSILGSHESKKLSSQVYCRYGGQTGLLLHKPVQPIQGD